MKKVFEFVVSVCLILVAAVILLGPLWISALGFWFTTKESMKAEGTGLLAGMAGFVVAWPYGVFAKSTAQKLDLFP